MMCQCEEAFARRFLPHQLDRATVLETQERLPVTSGFQTEICNECRGLPAEPAPKAPMLGSTSKIRRYYWRELYFETELRLAEAISSDSSSDAANLRKQIEKEVLDELKAQHTASPKYQFTELSQAEIIRRYEVHVERLDAHYLADGEKGRQIDDGAGGCSPERFVTRHYEGLGYEVMALESIPFHALFGVFMWLLIQDMTDEKVRRVSFGSRTAYDAGQSGHEINTFLPSDFGTEGYGVRRREAIEDHFELLVPERENLLDLFDYWTGHSDEFREYLWAHRPKDLARAKQLVEVLPPEVIVKILRYLVEDYWSRYCGWPDLLVFRDSSEFILVEVKSSRDKLSEDQKNWIEGNCNFLNLPFQLAKIHRA